MEITINNFKAITSLQNLELRPLTILAGSNSVGKTSFVQLLLMLKQSLEFGNSDAPLVFNKPYVSLGKFRDVVNQGNQTNNSDTIDVKFYFDQEDLFQVKRRFAPFGKNQPSGLTVYLSFSHVNGQKRTYVQHYSVTWETPEGDIYVDLLRSRGSQYYITVNSNLFFMDEYRSAIKKRAKIEPEMVEGWQAYVSFDGLFPDYNESFATAEYDPEYSDMSFSALANRHVSNILKWFLGNISYIGPLRAEPQSYYVNNDDLVRSIGNKGEFAAQILAKHSKERVTYHTVDSNEDGMLLNERKGSLEEAVSYWICEVFGMAKSLKVVTVQTGELHKIILDQGVKVPITQVGFGVSQVFPIVVEGCRLTPGSTLILEQPEIHLHPKVQSLLFDYLYSLTLRGVNVIIETHSDHFITRLRRRVVEDKDNELLENINLIFIERRSGENVTRILNISEVGSFDYWPEGFVDQADQDYRAIVMAQLKKKATRVSEEVDDN